MPITREQIFIIASTLNAEGIRPTLAAVRRRLGAGSFTTISDALNEWKVLQASQQSNLSQETPPELFLERLHIFGHSLWGEAMTMAMNRFLQDKEAIEEKYQEKETYYAELEKLAEEYQQELENAKQYIENLRQELKRSEHQLTETKSNNEQLQYQLTQGESIRKQTEQQCKDLQLELKRAHQKSDQLHQSFIELTAKFESMQTQLLKSLSLKKEPLVS